MSGAKSRQGPDDPTILLIGGPSVAGKTTLAESLSRRLGARYIDLDLFWIVLHASVPPEVAPELHLLDGPLAGGVDVWESPPAELVERYRRVSAYVARAIEPVIAHHHIVGRRVVIEGCWILPSFAVQRSYADRDTGDAVQAIFLLEPDIAAIEARIRPGRPSGWTG
jgi:2-phosphoglycerate kinase